MSQDKVNTAEQALAEQLLQGSGLGASSNKPFRDDLAELFRGSDFVIVKNPFDYPTGWTYVDPSEEKVNMPDKVTKHVEFGENRVRTLGVGKQVTIQGWEAYIALTRMFKEYAQKHSANVAIVLNSGEERAKFLEKAFGGIFDPNSLNAEESVADNNVVDKAKPTEAKASKADQATDDLGFAKSAKK